MVPKGEIKGKELWIILDTLSLYDVLLVIDLTFNVLNLSQLCNQNMEENIFDGDFLEFDIMFQVSMRKVSPKTIVIRGYHKKILAHSYVPCPRS